jgi:hypothetical protein
VYHGDPTQHRSPPLARITLAGYELLAMPMQATAAGHDLGSSSMGLASLCWEQHHTWHGALCWLRLCGCITLVLTLALSCLRMQVWYQHSSAEPPSS